MYVCQQGASLPARTLCLATLFVLAGCQAGSLRALEGDAVEQGLPSRSGSPESSEGGTLVAGNGGNSTEAVNANGATGFVPAPLPASPVSGLTLLGRWTQVGGGAQVRLAWAGTAAGVRFSGPRLTMDLQSVAAPYYNGTYFSRFEVEVDGTVLGDVVPTFARQTLTLADNLSSGEHTLWLRRRTEALFGVADIFAVDAPGGQVLAPPARPAHRVEVVGASADTGFYVDSGSDCSGEHQAAGQNALKAWPMVLARTLGVEVMNTTFSGTGVKWNLDTIPQPSPMSQMYFFANPLDKAVPWNLAAAVSEAIVANFGGNDWQVNEPLGLAQDAAANPFRAAAIAWGKKAIAQQGGQVSVYLLISPIQEDIKRPTLRALLGDVADALRGETRGKVAVLELPYQAGTACWQHPDAALHASWGAQVAARIKDDMGW